MIETGRLFLRQLRRSDYDDLCKILQDKNVMYAYEGAFSDAQVQEWLDKQLFRYKTDGFGLNAVILKESGQMIGQCGLTMQQWKNETLLEIGYLFQKEIWHKGYAIEAARACKKYAFNVLNAPEVFSIIRDNNIASKRLALRNGMKLKDRGIKH